MKPGQIRGSAKPVGKIRAGDTVVCQLENGYGGQKSPKFQQRCQVKAFFSTHVILKGFPKLQIPISVFQDNFIYIEDISVMEDAKIVK